MIFNGNFKYEENDENRADFVLYWVFGDFYQASGMCNLLRGKSIVSKRWNS